MAEITKEEVLEKLKTVKYPGFSRDIVSFNLIKGVLVEDGMVGVRLAVTSSDKEVARQLRREAQEAVLSIEGVTSAQVIVDQQEPVQASGAEGANEIPGVKHVIAVASGKGGVGKSTVSANLACALSELGLKTGLCDCDIYGPSIGLMFGVNERPEAAEDNVIIPLEAHGLKLMSMGFLLEDTSPAILRGPMVTRYTQHFLRQTDWNGLDVLVLDLPPGTGDIQLTIVQTVALSGVVIVTTPQEVALIDARKAASMFAKVNVDVLGIVENMSFFLCPNDGNRYDIFGTGGGQSEAKRLGVDLLAQVPLDIALRESGDSGKPITLTQPKSIAAQAFMAAANALQSKLLVK